jgi:NitT/TauT family transport system permease protein
MRKRVIIVLLISILLIIIWQYLGNHYSTFRLLLSSPILIINYFKENVIDLLLASGITLIEAVIGLLIAIFFSFSMMIFCFYNPKLMKVLLPAMVTSQVIPLIVLAPFFIMLLGIGLSSKIAMAAIMSFFPIFVNFAQGYNSISKDFHELMKIYQAPMIFKIKNVFFPLSLPNIIAGIKVSSTLSIIGAIVAEFSGAEHGLGKNLFISALRLEPELMMTSLILSSLIGLILFGTIRYFENRYKY